jgi:putative secretion ATPase (PEP-CTERM system associated)
MYERFYQLRERPFALSPDPDYLYPSRVHKEALSYLRFGIEGHAGFVVVTGEIGSGKTTLLQTLLRGLDQETTVARIVNTMLSPRELIEAILLEFGAPVPATKPAMVHALAEFLVAERQAGRLVLLVIDEAQNLSTDSLEEVRMLSNLETEKSKLIQIVLVGQPDLRATLDRPDLEQLRQRITVSYHLAPLDADDAEAYINHRLHRAAAGVPLEFPRAVTDLVHQRSGGVPRIMNVICDAVLLFGYGAERQDIDVALAREAISELEETGVLAREKAGRQAVTVSNHARPAAVAPETVESASAPTWSRTAFQNPAQDRAEQLAAARAHEERERTLHAREEAVTRREVALVEQRKVLTEQYRLLGANRPRQVYDRQPAASWPPAPAGPPAQTAPVTSFSPDAGGKRLWSRVRRVLGVQEPALDERS